MTAKKEQARRGAPRRIGDLPNLDTLKASVNIAAVIALCCDRQFYETGRRSELRCSCWRPAHSPDFRPSCRIDTVKQLFFCDVCGTGGGVFAVVRESLRCSFPRAVEWLREHRTFPPPLIHAAARAPKSLSASNPRPRSRRPGRHDVYPCMEEGWRVLYRKYASAATFIRSPS